MRGVCGACGVVACNRGEVIVNNAEILDTTAHLMAGPLMRGERELTDKEREHLKAAWTYIDWMLGPPDPREMRIDIDANSVCIRWREMGGKNE